MIFSRVFVPLGLLCGGLVACQNADEGPARPELVVFAASSLTEVLGDLARDFEADADADVVLHFAGSQALALQLAQGAPGAVFMSANEARIDELVAAGRAADVARFASNRLVVVTPAANPAGLRRYEDLVSAERVVLGAKAVPVGAYAEALLDASDPDFAAAVRRRVVSRENNVRLVLAKVELGEADAAIVYATDVTVSRRVHTIEVPADIAPRADYFMATVVDNAVPALVQRWRTLVTGPVGQRRLRERGFTVVER